MALGQVVVLAAEKHHLVELLLKCCSENKGVHNRVVCGVYERPGNDVF